MQTSRIFYLENGGPRLALRHRPAKGPRRGAVLFVHGATFASELYDLPIPGYSWMEAAAEAGREAFAVDLRGYALSERPPSFDRPAAEAPPYARAQEVLSDIDRAVEAVRAKTGDTRIDLIGGSWGTVTCGIYASGANAGKVRRLALYAPLYGEWNDPWLSICGAPGDPGRLNPDLGAYRWVEEAAIRQRWDGEIPTADTSVYREEAVFQSLFRSALEADPLWQTRSPPAFRVPNGTLVDLHAVFSGHPLYDPAEIRLPVLLLRGADDPTSTDSDTSRLYDALGTKERHYRIVPQASHFAMAEKAASKVFQETEAFLSA